MNEVSFDYMIERTPIEHGHSRMFTAPVRCAVAPDGKTAKLIKAFCKERLTPVEIRYIEEEAIYIWKEQHENNQGNKKSMS